MKQNLKVMEDIFCRREGNTHSAQKLRQRHLDTHRSTALQSKEK